MGLQVNKRQLAEFLGKTERTLTDWQDEDPPLPILERGERGGENIYDSADVVEWLMSRTLRKAGKAESQRDRLTRLQADALEMDNKVKSQELVPVSQVEPVWYDRVLSAAAFMQSRGSRLAGILEATPGLEAKRKILREEDAAFLTKLGVDGERMQREIERLLESVSEEEAKALLARISGNDGKPSQPGTPGGNQSDLAPPGAGKEGTPE